MPKTVIFANGIPNEDLSVNQAYIAPDDTIICANGGTLHAIAMGITPNMIVGDLDSLPEAVYHQMVAQQVDIRQHPAKKDQTDLELAFSLALDQGTSEILLLTALGGRLDQHLANILLLTRPEWQGVRLSIAEGRQRAWLLRGAETLIISGRLGDTLSVVPLTSTLDSLDIENVEWPLKGASVSLGSTLTISNTFLAEQTVVRLKTGMALVVHIQQTEKSPHFE